MVWWLTDVLEAVVMTPKSRLFDKTEEPETSSEASQNEIKQQEDPQQNAQQDVFSEEAQKAECQQQEIDTTEAPVPDVVVNNTLPASEPDSHSSLEPSPPEPALAQEEEPFSTVVPEVDLSKYPAIDNRQTYREIVSRQGRGLTVPLLKSYGAKLFKKVPDPIMLTHIVTTTCNYMCSFCSFSDTLNTKTNELSLEEIEEVYTSIGHNLNVIVYSGGETTLNKNLPEIIEAAYRRTPVKSVYIISNAWKPNLIFEITNQVMQRCPGLHLTWSLSIEGPKEYNNIERRTRAENWDAWQNTIEAMVGLKALREKYDYKELNVQLCTVCSPDNYQLMDNWYETVRDTLKPDKWNLNLMRRSVQMTEHQLESFDSRRQKQQLDPFEQKYIDITKRVRQDVLSGKLKFLYHTDNPMDGALKSAVDLISQEQNRNTVLQKTDLFPCQSGYTGAYISSEGDVSGCEEFAHSMVDNKSYGNLREHHLDFQSVWHSQKAQQLRAQTGCAKECQGCTLESQRNYPSILVSFKTLAKAMPLGQKIMAAKQ